MCSAVQKHSVQCSAVQLSAVQFNEEQCSEVQPSSLPPRDNQRFPPFKDFIGQKVFGGRGGEGGVGEGG